MDSSLVPIRAQWWARRFEEWNTRQESNLRQDSNLHDCYTITGFRPDKHANARLQGGGEQMTRTSHPCGCPLFSKQVPALLTLLSKLVPPGGFEPPSARLKGVALPIELRRQNGAR